MKIVTATLVSLFQTREGKAGKSKPSGYAVVVPLCTGVAKTVKGCVDDNEGVYTEKEKGKKVEVKEMKKGGRKELVAKEGKEVEGKERHEVGGGR